VTSSAALGASGSPAEVAGPFRPGALIDGKFRIERKLAEGGIGVVVAATHVALNQLVAIKYLKPHILADTNLVERFEREGRLAAQIASEHVVRVYDIAREPNAGPYMVMEYLVGKDLGQVLEDGPLAIPRAVDYVLQACDALAAAHALDIVHRDIKPQNLFLSERPSNAPILKIIDFGVSKVAPKRKDNQAWARETNSNDRFGTPLYMPPEQLRASPEVDGRADIWSLGVTLFELLTGEPPFMGDDLPELCTSILTEPPRRLRELRPGVPEELEEVILKCLEKQAKLRYRNVAELAHALVPFAPPDSAHRAVRISQVMRTAGASVRPPRPVAPRLEAPRADLPGSMGARTTLPEVDESRTRPTVRLRGATRGRVALVAAVVVAAGVAIALGVAARRSRQGHQDASPPRSSATAMASVSSPVPAPVEGARTTTPSAEAAAPTTGSPASSAAASPSARPTRKPNPRPGPTAGAGVRPEHSVPAADPRAKFGERE
jgi:serine/threonine protein kinase